MYLNFFYLAYLATKQFVSPLIPTSNANSVSPTGANSNILPELEEAIRSIGKDHPTIVQLEQENQQVASGGSSQDSERERIETQIRPCGRERDVQGRFLIKPKAGELNKTKTSEEKERDQIYSKVSKWKKGATKYMQKIQKAT